MRTFTHYTSPMDDYQWKLYLHRRLSDVCFDNEQKWREHLNESVKKSVFNTEDKWKRYLTDYSCRNKNI
jgi:hypothetical protein